MGQFDTTHFPFFPLPSRLHEVLMDLQQQQLQQLSDWLSQTEQRIMKIETEPAAKDVEVYKEQIEQHQVNPLSLYYLFIYTPEITNKFNQHLILLFL